MSDTPETTPENAPAASTDTPQEPAQEQAPYIIEGARSSRSRCKTCRRKIDKGALRIGVLVEGPYGIGYMWHHLRCLARRQFERVEEAYEQEAWNQAKELPKKVPELESLQQLREQAEEKRKSRKQIPYAEVDPSGRAKCKHCNQPLPKGELRVILGRDVEFGNQVRTGPINVHPRCVAAEMDADDCSTEVEGFRNALRSNSTGLSDEQLEAVLAEIGDLT